MRPTSLLWLCAIAPAMGVAQAGTAPPSALCAAQEQDLQSEFEALSERLATEQKDFRARSNELFKSFDSASAGDAERKAFQEKVDALRKDDPSAKYVPQFEELAKRAAKSEVAIDCWLQVLALDAGNAPDEGQPMDTDSPTHHAIAALLADHIASPRMADLTTRLSSRRVGDERYAEVMRTLREKSPSRDVQAAALYAQLRANMPYSGGTPEQTAAARKVGLDLQKNFADLSTSRGKNYADIASSALFQAERLQIGMVAPDYACLDENGKHFKLSDYKGKVVVLDFWGFW